MNQQQKSKHDEIQVQIIRSSINHLQYSMDLCDTSSTEYWQNAKKEIRLKIAKEEFELECYKVSNPELFI